MLLLAFYNRQPTRRLIPMDKLNNLFQMIWTYSQETPDKVALICNNEEVTYRQLYETSHSLAIQLAKRLAPGSTVVLHLPNSLQLIYAYLGCFAAGLIVVPMSIKLKSPEINYILKQTKPAYFISHHDNLAELQEINFDNDNFQKLFIVNGIKQIKHQLPDAAHSFEELLIYSKENFSLPTPPTEAAVFFTSGSTGTPKGVVHSHSSLFAMAKNIAYCADLSREDKFYVSEAMTNASGFTHVMSALCNGATVILADEINVLSSFVKDLRFYQPTILSIMGKANFEIVHDSSITAADFQSVRVNLTGGDKITKSLLKKFKEKTNVSLRQGYGMSEVLCITINKSPYPNKLGSIGTATKDVTIILADKNHQPVSAGQVGEVLVSGPNVMLKYWNDVPLTQKTIVNGMLCTGDLAYMDQDGYYWFYGRLKQIIVRGGDNISPFEIEEVLMQHDAVKLVGVVGKPDILEGEVPVAFVVLKNKNVDPNELLAFTASRLEEFKIPTIIYIVDHLPLTKSNKIDRNKLKELIPK